MLGNTVMMPVYPTVDDTDLRVVPLGGYSGRAQVLPDGRTLIAGVQNNPANDTWDYYYRFVCDFAFDPVP